MRYIGPAGGYLYCKSIKNKLDVVRGVSNGVDYVRKSLTIKDSERVFHETYLGNDAAFFLQNPLYPTDYFADCISWVNHTTYLDRENGVREYSFCTTAYNGGDVSDVMSQCWAKWKEVPEWFIWHVVRKMARAIAWLLLGYRDNRPLPVRWDPMMQRDLASNK